MATSLDPCVRAILCGLSNAALAGVKSLITTQLAFVTAQLALITAQLAQYNILATAVQASANFVEGQIQDIRAAANLIPLQLISGCVGLGDLNLSINADIDKATAQFEAFVADATRILSFIDELNLVKEALQQEIDLYNAILSTISLCGGGGAP